MTVAFVPSECKGLNRRAILNIGYQLVGTVKHSDGKMHACGPRGWRSIGHSVTDFLKQYVPEEDIAELQFATPKKEKK